MGASIGQALLASGHAVLWVAAGRSVETQARAVEFEACQTLETLLGRVDALISVCPPHAALTQGEAVRALGFSGLYVDANAVAPATAARLGALFDAAYVDGGVIGPPAKQPGTTRLYLSGPRAREVAHWFHAGALQAIALDGALTAASTLKMAYAAYTKGSSALLLAVNALASRGGVRDALLREWDLSQPELTARSERTARATAPKAWRFVGEMDEIAATFRAMDLPDGFHVGAAEIYQAMAALKDQPAAAADLDTVLEAIASAAKASV
jgi:hypothetical protein